MIHAAAEGEGSDVARALAGLFSRSRVLAFEPASAQAATTVVTRCVATKPCIASLRQCSANIRPRNAWHRCRCSPSTLFSSADVSTDSANDAVLQRAPAWLIVCP